MLRKNNVIFFAAVSFILVLCTCKKYPENTLWFKNPEKIPFITGNMTHWIVNGTDSIIYLDNYFYNDINNNPYTHVFADLEFRSYNSKKGQYSCNVNSPSDYQCIGDAILGLEYMYSEKSKKIKITSITLGCYKKNIFISKDIVWDIIYLSKKDKKRKLKGTYNGNVYEIQFN